MKIFVSDYDGTFAKMGGSPSEIQDNVKQVNAWREAGNIFAFATGRSVPMLNKFIPKEMGYDYLVALNGGIVTDARTNEKLFEKAMSNEVATEIMALVKEWDFSSYSITDGFSSYRKMKTSDFTSHAKFSIMQKMVMAIKMSTFFMWHNVNYNTIISRPVAQITVAANSNDKVNRFAELVNEQFHGKASVYINNNSADIGYFGISKATGVDYVRELLNTEAANIYCMGDSYNDIPMLEAYQGFTLPDAPDEVKAKSEEVFNSVGDAIKSLL